MDAALIRWLAGIKKALDRLVEAIAACKEANPSQKQKGGQTELKTIVSLPVEITEYYESEQGERGKRNRREGIRTVLECVGVVAAIILAILTFCSLRTARRANGDLERQFQAQQRAWVGNGQIEIEQTTFLVYPDNPIQGRTQVNLFVDVPLNNVGNSPAFNVETSMNATMTEQITSPPTAETMMESTCGNSDKNANSAGQVLFPKSPGITAGWPVDVQVPFIQINQVHRVWIDICVTYSGTTFDQQIHHTKIWMASWPINGTPTKVRRTAQPRVIYYSLPIPKWEVIRTEAD